MWSEARAIGHLVFVEAAPGIITVLPEWMLDPVICAGMELGTPRVAVEALINLQRQLSDGGFWGYRRPSNVWPRKPKSLTYRRRNDRIQPPE